MICKNESKYSLFLQELGSNYPSRLISHHTLSFPLCSSSVFLNSACKTDLWEKLWKNTDAQAPCSNWIRCTGRRRPGIANFSKLLRWLSCAVSLRIATLAKRSDFLNLLYSSWLQCLHALHTTWIGKEPTPVSEILPPDWISAQETFLQRWSHSSISERNPKENFLLCQLVIHEIIDNIQNIDWVMISINEKKNCFLSFSLYFKTRHWDIGYQISDKEDQNQ